jgi:hypothetical protein
MNTKRAFEGWQAQQASNKQLSTTGKKNEFLSESGQKFHFN